jgi:uncharacterized membrane protein
MAKEALIVHSNRTQEDLGRTVSGLDPIVAGALSYLLFFLSGILFYIVEKDNPYVRFHALQSTIFFGALFVITMILQVIPVLGFILNFFLWLGAFTVWLFLMVKAAQGVAFKLPIVGEIAERNI